MAILAAAYIALIFLLPLGLSAWVGFRSLPCGRRCPRCGGDALLLRAPGLALTSRLLPGTRMQRRWCPACAWEGTVRCHGKASRAPLTIPAAPARRRPSAERQLATSAPPAPPDAVDLRSLHLDGTAWRVRLEFWERTGRCFGRLVFVDPDGRSRTDALRPFTGRSRGEVVGKALALSEGSLTHRLRHVVTE